MLGLIKIKKGKGTFKRGDSMNKTELVGLIFCMTLVGGIFISLYPKRLAIAMEDNMTRLASNYNQDQLLKIKLLEQKLRQTKDNSTRKRLRTQAKKIANKAHDAARYAKTVVQEAERLEADSKKKGMSETYFVKQAQISAQQAQQYADYIKTISDDITVTSDPETKRQEINTDFVSEI